MKNIKHRLTLRFVIQLAVSGVIVLILAGLCILWVLHRFEQINLSKDFASVGLEKLVESSQLGSDGFVFDTRLLDQVKANNGWLQSLDEEGRVTLSYNTPQDVPMQYDPGELLAYWVGHKPFPYGLYLWIQEKDGKLFTLIYGVKNEMEPLMNQVKNEARLAADGSLQLPDTAEARLKALGGYVQWLDITGKELGSYNKPDHVPHQYTIQELALRLSDREHYGYAVVTSYDQDTGRTWLIALPNTISKNPGAKSFLPPEAKVVILGVTAMFLAMLLVFILLSLWNAHRFGAPMLHTMAWLDSLSHKIYREPMDRKGLSISRNASGQWKRRYRTYAEVMLSLDKLSTTLQRDETMREQTQELREQWISGITHDLKTPLSSIKGYAHLLAEGQYDWTNEEVRTFSRVMLEKSTHMDTLINDLAMTYRLQAGIRPPETEELDLHGWLRDYLARAASDPEHQDHLIQYEPTDKHMTVHTYTPWLQRIVDNLIANAFLHNHPDTMLTISLQHDHEQEQAILTFRDSGSGMDERTLEGLFERYYRGTNTIHSTEGSGLGMAISKGLVEALGGTVSAESEWGKGTTIQLKFPCKKATA